MGKIKIAIRLAVNRLLDPKVTLLNIIPFTYFVIRY